MESQKNKQALAPFQPAWWCPGAHTQTIMGALLVSRPPFKLKRLRFDTPDGDFLDLDFLEDSLTPTCPDAPLTVILHGLEGSSKAPYIQNLLLASLQRKQRAVVINMRMCSGEPNRLETTYHSGKTEDLDCVIHQLINQHAESMIHLVGFSIGGNIVLKWLGEQGDKVPRAVRQAVAISVPYDLAQSVAKMDQGFNRQVYTRSLLARLKQKLLAKERLFPSIKRYNKVKHCDTFTVFDREVTSPLNGFKDEHDYWSKSSCKSFLQSIRVPTRLIHAMDDPFFPGHLIPFKAIQKSRFLEPLVVPYGGHIGFVDGFWKRATWLQERILNFTSESLVLT